MTTKLAKALKQVNDAKTASDLFNGDVDKAHELYRDLSKTLHPDRVPDNKKDEATQAFAKLSTLYGKYSRGETDDVLSGPVTVTTRKHTYVVGGQLARGDVATLYRVEYSEDNATKPGALKLVRTPTNNDLVENEARVLKHLRSKIDPKGIPFVSEMLDAFRYRDADTGSDHNAIVLTPLDGFYTLAEVKAAFPSGLDFRDVAWMWKRLLIAIGHAHRAGVVHGAVIPEHVMIHPELHGLCLVDWAYAVMEQPITASVVAPTLSWGALATVDTVDTGVAVFPRLTAIVPSRHEMYPPEVFAKEPATSSTDIYMASKTIATLLNDQTPRAFWAFLNGCTRARPEDAWQVMKELDDLLYDHVGPRKFRPFAMPKVTA